MSIPGQHRLCTIPITFLLAATICACTRPLPAPSPTVQSTPRPSQTATTWLTATPSPTRRSTLVTPQPAAVPVALTLDEAAEHALWLVNPRNEPRVLFSRYIMAGDILSSTVDIGMSDLSALKRVGRDAPLILVGVESQDPDDSSRVFEWPSLTGAVFDAATGRLKVAGWVNSSSTDLLAIPTAAIIPVRGPSPSPTPNPAPAWTPSPTPHALPTDVRDLLPSTLRGRPLERDLVNESVLATLKEWPLLPGNRWTYSLDENDSGAWAGATITQSVVAAEVLRPDVLLVTCRSTSTTSPQTADLIAHGWWYFWADAYASTEPRETACWYVIRDGDVYFTDDFRQLEVITSFVMSAEPTPTAPLYPIMTEDVKPIPMVRYPIAVGDQRPLYEFGAFWTIEAEESAQTWAGRMDGCFRDFHPGNANEHRWFCPGVGLARLLFLKTWYQVDQQLTSFDIATTVDDLP